MSEQRQNNQPEQLGLAFPTDSRSEAPSAVGQGTEALKALRHGSTYRPAGYGPACPVVWQGRAGNRAPYAECVR